MRLAATWTRVMAVVIACYATLIAFVILGGEGLAWVLALPAMFFGLQFLGLGLILLCEFVERRRVLPRKWRPLMDEVLIVVALCLLGAWCLPMSVATGLAGFFAAMYLLRLLAWKAWVPGEAVEVAP